jgi:hypothetical protein
VTRLVRPLGHPSAAVFLEIVKWFEGTETVGGIASGRGKRSRAYVRETNERVQ